MDAETRERIRALRGFSAVPPVVGEIDPSNAISQKTIAALRQPRASTLPGYGQPSVPAEFLGGFIGGPPRFSVMDPEAQQLQRARDIGQQASVAADLYGAASPFAIASTTARRGQMIGVSEMAKARTKTAEPLQLFHGTNQTFGKFEIEKDERNVGGTWLTDDSGYANWIARQKTNVTGNANVLPVAAAIKNPMIFDVVNEGKKFARQIGVPEPQTSLEAQEVLSGGLGWDRVVADLVSEAKSKGFDALKLERFDDNYGRETNAYVAFKPRQLQIAKPSKQISFDDYLTSRNLKEENGKIFSEIGKQRFEMNKYKIEKDWEQENKLRAAMKGK
jgi:hypothetical protein